MFSISRVLINHPFQKLSFVNNCISASSIHTSKFLCDNKKKDPPSDFLPFPWTRKEKNNVVEQSGDLVKFLECDPNLPKPDFEHSKELKTANEAVKKFFSMATALPSERREVCRRETIKRVQRHPLDFDSLEVKIAELTIQVRNLFEHKERSSRMDRRNNRFVLPIIIQKRNRKLRELWLLDTDRFNWLLKELKLEFIPTPLGPPLKVKYTRKNDMRYLTKEYCEKMIADKRAVYHEELKKEQELFKEEKAKILAWIEEEEKAIKALNL